MFGVSWYASCPKIVLTILVVLADVFSCQGVLFFHLIPQMFLTLLQHIELRAQSENRILGGVLLRLGGAAAKPA